MDKFNLVDDPWIPVSDHGLVSLGEIFRTNTYRTLGGNPVEKLALMKLLLAIGQAATTPQGGREWKDLGAAGLAASCTEYLERWHDRFHLHGSRPFLQMPEIAAARKQPYGAVLPEVSTGNTTVLSQIQIQRPLDEADKALLLVCLMGFALAGKKTDNSINLSPGYEGKRNAKGKQSSSPPGPGIGYRGLLHSFFVGSTLIETLWLNLLTKDEVARWNMFPLGIGVAPWERMPIGEDCAVARELRQSLMGCLVPLCRFCLLQDDGLHYSEGVAHPNYKQGVVDPMTATNFAGKEPKALWVNPEKRPWRELTGLLAFVGNEEPKGFQSLQIRSGLDRIRDAAPEFAIWSGGLRVSSTAGEQFVSGADDFVESVAWLRSDALGSTWFAQLKAEMLGLESLEKYLYGRIVMFFKDQKAEGSRFAARATHLFWQFCERDFQELVDSCEQDEQSKENRRRLRLRFSGYVHRIYDQFCPRESARQVDAWARHRPDNIKYLKLET